MAKTQAERSKRYRDGKRDESVTQPSQKRDVTATVTRPANFGQPGCEYRHCANVWPAGSKHKLYHGLYKPASELSKDELNRIALPGDVDYKPSTCRPCVPGEAVALMNEVGR